MYYENHNKYSQGALFEIGGRPWLGGPVYLYTGINKKGVSKMRIVTLEQFRKHGFGLFKKLGVKKLRLKCGKTSRYINMYIYDGKKKNMERKGEYLVDKEGKKFRECMLCGSMSNVRWVVPFDGSAQAGAYCYYCRHKNSIMDVKDAKRYGKIL